MVIRRAKGTYKRLPKHRKDVDLQKHSMPFNWHEHPPPTTPSTVAFVSTKGFNKKILPL